MKYNRFVVPKSVEGLYNVGKIIMHEMTHLKNKSHEETVAILEKHIEALDPETLKEVHLTSQILLNANKNYIPPYTEVTYFKQYYPGYLKVIENFLDPDYHSPLKKKVLGL